MTLAILTVGNAGCWTRPQLNARAGNLISFLNNEPFTSFPSDLDKISPEGLSAFYEIGFSNSNLQRLNLEGRLDDLREGARGSSSNMKVNGANANLEGNDSNAVSGGVRFNF
jgi:hypothetical protein